MTVTTAINSRLYIGPVRPSVDALAVVTMTIASPGVVTDTGSNMVAGQPIILTTTGALPTGLLAGTTYFVKNPTANTYELALTVGGASIITSGTQSGVHTRNKPAVTTAAGYAVLTWVEVGEVENLGEFGDEYQVATFAALADARRRKLKSILDAGTAAFIIGRDPQNVGQQAMKAAAKTKYEYAFKIQAADALDANDTNSVYYFGALVLSARDNYGDSTNVVKTMFNTAINTDIVEVAATVVP